MAAVTQVITNYLGGVSRQSDQKKLPGQVRECLNALPDPTFGLRKRPGTKFIKQIVDKATNSTFTSTNAKWFYIDNTVDNQRYIGHIDGQNIRVWNTDGTACTITNNTFNGLAPHTSYLDASNKQYDYDVLTVQATSIITNKKKVIEARPAVSVPASKGTIFLTQVKYATSYSVKIGIHQLASGKISPDAFITINSTSETTDDEELTNTALYILNGVKAAINAKSFPGTMLVTSLASSLELDFKTFDVYPRNPSDGVHSGVSNGTGGGTLGDNNAPITYTNVATTTSGSGTGLTVDVTIGSFGGINGVATDVRVHQPGSGYATDDTITIAKANVGNTQTDVIVKIPDTLQDWPFTLEVIENQGNVAMLGYTNQVSDITKIPDQSIHGRTVKIMNTLASDSSYWTRFVADDGVLGTGFWEETVDPSVSPGLKGETMPHELVNTGINTFNFQQALTTDGTDSAWANRVVGDDETNSQPSFIVSDGAGGFVGTISKAFFHNNRLGFLTEDNVSMSQSNQFYNFYHTSALTASDSDPIDLNCTSIRPAPLHGVIPTAQGLILFSKNQQFIMFSDSEILTPASAVIRGIANYEMDDLISPVDVGTTINFISKTPSYTRVFSAATRGSEESPVVDDIGKIISEWIPSTIDTLISSPQNSLIALYGRNSPDIYYHKTHNVGERNLMQSWFKWTMPGDVQFVTIDSDVMWIIIKSGTNHILLKANVSKATDEDVIQTEDGQLINPHMDLYTPASEVRYKEVKSASVDNNGGGTAYTFTPPVTIGPPSLPSYQGGVQAEAVAVLNNAQVVTGITITKGGSGYTAPPKVTIGAPWQPNTDYSTGDNVSSDGGHWQAIQNGTSGSTDPPTGTTTHQEDDGTNLTWSYTGVQATATATIETFDGSKCYVPFTDIAALDPVILVKGSSGFTISPNRDVGEVVTDGGSTYFKIPKRNFYGSASDVYVGYQYSYDVELPKTYFKLNPEGTIYDYPAALTIARMKFAVGLSSGVGFKMKRKGYVGPSATFVATANTPFDVGAAGPPDTRIGKSVFEVPFPLKKENGVIVRVDGDLKVAGTHYTYTSTDDQGTVTFLSGHVPHKGASVPNANNNIPSDDQRIEITTDTWYTVNPVQDANQYPADAAPLTEEAVFTLPIHQKTDNFDLRIFSNSPFPISLNSMMWEGNYSPRFYRRA